ncbi:helix-turn-helix domain-containing protein [Undibacterium sp. Xuan67W]|uniref:helix-turn-helix domain-containing protein n=1 Tax=Undibacterium sp. Xuan67W TaxID=3413057 RepID=UPI003BF2E137
MQAKKVTQQSNHQSGHQSEQQPDTSPDINQRIANRLSSLRAERSMSLDALATKSGVSRSMISLIERGESSPTAVVLDKLSFGLGVTLASFFEEPQPDANPLVRREAQLQWTDPQSGYRRRNISPPHFRSSIQLVEVEFRAGARVSYAAGLREVGIHQQVWILDGSLEIILGDVHHHLESGDCLAMDENNAIVYQNTSKRPVRYVVAINTSSL